MTPLFTVQHNRLALVPDPEHPDYQEGYAAGKGNAKLELRGITQGWQCQPVGACQQWNDGHAQAFYDAGLINWSPFSRGYWRLKPGQSVRIQQDDQKGRAEAGQTGSLVGFFPEAYPEFVIIELDLACQCTHGISVVTTTIDNLQLLAP